MKRQHNYPTGCFSAAGVTNGDLLCVGGTFPGVRNLFLSADFETFGQLFSKVQYTHNKLLNNTAQCGQWLQDCGSNTDPDTFLALHAFQSVLKADYPEVSNNAKARRDLYSEDIPALLSDVVKANAAQCAEIALLAHAALNHLEIDNEYVSGSVAWRSDDEFPEEHCYIRISSKDKIIIYDPSNPVVSNQGQFPAIYEVDDKQSEIFEYYATRSSAFMSLKNTLTHDNAFYGVHDGTGIDLSRFTIEANNLSVQQAEILRGVSKPSP